MPNPYSLYFHIPFCAHRCAYCDFNTYAGQSASIPAYVNALCNEIKIVGTSPERSRSVSGGVVEGRLPVHTIFFGGGTPSLLTAEQYRDIFRAISTHFDVTKDAEISLEANPGTVSLTYLADLREIGFNRISYGMQSANPAELRLLERIHTYDDVVDAVNWSRQAGFDNLNLDLIYGLPEQTLARWQETVKRALDLHPEHLSAYALTIEPGTPFGRRAEKGLLPLPNPDIAADQYERTMEFLAGNGYAQYEISNWSLPGRECRHNLQYWRNLDYLGLGAGAHGYASSVRYSNVLRIKTYIERLTSNFQPPSFPLSPAAVYQHHNTLKDDMQETLMTGLRLTLEGVSATDFRQRFRVELLEVFGKEIEELIRLGLLEWSADPPLPNLGEGWGVRVRLTPRGRLLGNQVFIRFVGD